MAFALSATPTAGTGTISIAQNGTTVTGVGTDLIPNEPAAVGSPMTLAIGVVANANIVQVNAVPVSGTGAEGDEWGPAA